MDKKVAKGISYLFHPLLFPTYILLLLLNVHRFMSPTLPLVYRMVLTGIVVMTTLLFPLFLTWVLYKLRLITSFYLDRREERIYPVMTVAVFYYVTYFMLKGVQISSVFSYYMLGATLLAVLTLIITLFHKISLHSVAIGSYTGLFLGLTLQYGLNFTTEILSGILLAGLVGFARLGMQAHKPSEIYSGFTAGVVVMVVLIVLL
jgi:hypothetical protein